MSTDVSLKISEIQRFCMHDGPGVRTTVFLQGCPLHCSWCHNQEMQSTGPSLLFYKSRCIGCNACAAVCPSRGQRTDGTNSPDRQSCILCGACTEVCPTGAAELSSREMTVEEIVSVALRDKAFYQNGGGVTLSGGEPLMQGVSAVALLKACRMSGLSTAVETCGHVSPETLRAAAPYTDLFLFDLKDTDPDRHRQYTGVTNELILNNLALLNQMKAKIRLRCILVNRVNTDMTHYLKLAELARGVENLDGLEFIPYHAYGGTKAVFLGGEDSGRAEWIPDEWQVAEAKEALASEGIRIIG